MSVNVFPNLPITSLDLLTATRISFYRAYDQASQKPAYRDWQQLCAQTTSTKKRELRIFPSPMQGLREWIGERPMSQMDWSLFWVQNRRFADGISIDVDDASDEEPAVFAQAAAALGESAALWVPRLVASAVLGGLTKKWQPDGQAIWDVHYFNPKDPAVGSARNYYSKTVQGGSAAKPLNYANLKAVYEQGYTYKLPNGDDCPVIFTHLVVPPALAPLAEQLTQQQTLVVNPGDFPQPNLMYGRLKVAQLGGLNNPNLWMLVDASTDSGRSVVIQVRQPVTWQQLGGTGPGDLTNDEGEVSESVFRLNQNQYGPKARGEAYFQNWWGAVLCDGTP